MEEQKLLLGLQQKEEQALEECVWQYGAYAAAVVRAAGPGLSPQDVEEVAAEAFVKLWQAADRLDVSKGTLKSYLGAVCRNEARSRLRTLRPMEPLPEDFLAPAEQAAQNLERKELERLTREAVDMSDIPFENWMTVEETIFSLKTGLNPRQNFKLNEGGQNPYITGKDIYNNSINVTDKTDFITEEVVALINKRACLETNDVLFASTGTGTVGRMAVVDCYDNLWAVSETIFCLKPKPNAINPYYLMYALYTRSAKNQFEPKISKGSVPHLKVKDLLGVKIPVPNLIVQKKVIDLMHRFDIVYNDLTSGLPAEIAARQKQYEYYRDKLLTFKEKA